MKKMATFIELTNAGKKELYNVDIIMYIKQGAAGLDVVFKPDSGISIRSLIAEETYESVKKNLTQ
jgi:hypothetical protein